MEFWDMSEVLERKPKAITRSDSKVNPEVMKLYDLLYITLSNPINKTNHKII